MYIILFCFQYIFESRYKSNLFTVKVKYIWFVPQVLYVSRPTLSTYFKRKSKRVQGIYMGYSSVSYEERPCSLFSMARSTCYSLKTYPLIQKNKNPSEHHSALCSSNPTPIMKKSSLICPREHTHAWCSSATARVGSR